MTPEIPPLPGEVPQFPEEARVVDVSLWRSLDTETYRFSAGCAVPKIVCASTARIEGGAVRGELLVGRAAVDVFRDLFDVPCTCSAVGAHAPTCLRRTRVVAFANAPYDLVVAMQADPTLRWPIFQALRDGRVHDILTAESLHAIRGGHLGEMPDGSPLYNPSTGEQTKRYSLALSAYLTLGRRDTKENDVWRQSYALLDGVPVECWPEVARVYPVDDARNTLDVAVAQVLGRPSAHDWACGVCRLCGEQSAGSARESCPRSPRSAPHENIENLSAQVEADFAFKLGACWGLRTDLERVEALSRDVNEKHAVAVARFQKKGWVRENGTEDQAAVKRAIAVAYGAQALCAKCGGTGKVRPVKQVDCRGPKARGRYLGCQGIACACSGTGKVEKVGGEVTCKNVFDANERFVEAGCDGTGFDLDSVRVLPRSDKLGVKTDRDTKAECGDEEMAVYGEDHFEKSRTTYVPYLFTGTTRSLSYSIDVLKATGRASIEGSPLHQMPRFGNERRCIRARGTWCGHPVETVLGSTDYSAGELCTLAQGTYWLFSYSQMREAINASGDPGILHSELAAEVMGVSLQEFLVRYKAKDQQAVYFRQASKPENFGKPAGMGAPKIVLTNRKESAGFTVCEGGPATNSKGQEGYHGIRFCVLVGGAKRCGDVKITEWGKKRYPCAPVCKACVEIEAHVLSPAYFRRFPEIKDYHKWVTRMVDNHEPAPSVVWDHEAQAARIIRLRGGCDFSAFANNLFQSMLSDIMKAAYVRATRECYLGVQDDGAPSPLAGCHLPLAAHDETISELILDTAHLSGPRIATIMVEEGYRIAPQVTWKAETAIMEYWYKAAEPRYVDGKLVVWKPEGGR